MKFLICILSFSLIVLLCYMFLPCTIPLSEFLEDDVLTDSVTVLIDGTSTSIPVSYFGDDIVKEISEVFVVESTVRERVYYKLKLKSDNILGLIYTVKRIEHLPEVDTVFLKHTYILENFKVSNDPLTNDPTQWGLFSVGIDKVWDFTTGSNREYLLDTPRRNARVLRSGKAS